MGQNDPSQFMSTKRETKQQFPMNNQRQFNPAHAYYKPATSYCSTLQLSSYDEPKVASNGGGSSLLGDTWSWAKDHFYIGAEGEITYGLQVAATLKNGLGFNLSPYHVVRAEGSWNNKNRPLPKFKSNEKLKIHDFGVAYYVGVNYNQTIDYSRSYNGIKTNTISVGAFGVVGVTFNFNENWNFMKGYGGVDISGKVAVVWGASGSLKLGFEF